MNKMISFGLFIMEWVLLLSCGGTDRQADTSAYVISKENGRIILAYKAFIDFLETDRSWDTYQRMVLDAYPQVQVVHERQLGWGAIDSATFPEQLRNLQREDFTKFLTQYSEEQLNYLYDSIILMAHEVLPPVGNSQVDLCFFLPYGSCFVVPVEGRNTIFVSMWINPDDIEKIMAHEYGHVLHHSRAPEEPLSLKRELVSEGMAVYLTNQILKDIEVSNSIPFMPESSFKWCMENERTIKDSIRLELNDTTDQLFIRYIADGSFAKPPEGFVQKTAYYIGYRIVEECVRQGMDLETICKMNAGEVIGESGYFD